MSDTVQLGDLNPKQKQFMQARTRYVAYGGARGGGKSHVLRIKAIAGAVHYPDLRILIVRREYPELEQGLILPMKKMIPESLAVYNGTMRLFAFYNGSVIKFGHYGTGDDTEYQGQEYDWIFIDEATQFTEMQFLTLGACLRGSLPVPRRIYLTCNPGGIGHAWVKRLFVDRLYNDAEDPSEYTFIPATVDDNPHLLAASPHYRRMLDVLPENLRRAWRDGDWDALSGVFFPEFSADAHLIRPLRHIPRHWRRYRAIDYGLDGFACLWIAVDGTGRAYVYRECLERNLVVSQAAERMRELTPPDEDIFCTYAPGDLWSRQKDTGRTMEEIFAACGAPLVRASRARRAGWMAVKESLRAMHEGEKRGGLLICENCRALIRSLRTIQHDVHDPNDCATEPHDITHMADALRYFCVMHRPAQAVFEETDAGDAAYLLV